MRLHTPSIQNTAVPRTLNKQQFCYCFLICKRKGLYSGISKDLLVLLSSFMPYHGALLGAGVDPTPLSIDRINLPRRMDFELALKMESRERIWKMGNEDCSRHRNNGSRDSEIFLKKISKVNKNMGPSLPSGTAFKSQCCCALDV